jgi:hypothetical protein
VNAKEGAGRRAIGREAPVASPGQRDVADLRGALDEAIRAVREGATRVVDVRVRPDDDGFTNVAQRRASHESLARPVFASRRPSRWTVRLRRRARPCRGLRGWTSPGDESWIPAAAAQDLEAFDAYTDEMMDREAGFGGHEVCTWVAGAAAMRAAGPFEMTLDYNRLIPEWITGMAVARGAPAG